MLNIVKTKGKNLSILVYDLFLLREHNIFRHRYIGCLHEIEIEIWLGEKIGLTLSMRIFQATHIQCPQTLTGAYLSGLREAEKIIRSMADITWQDKYNWTTFLPNSLLFKNELDKKQNLPGDSQNCLWKDTSSTTDSNVLVHQKQNSIF